MCLHHHSPPPCMIIIITVISCKYQKEFNGDWILVLDPHVIDEKHPTSEI